MRPQLMRLPLVSLIALAAAGQRLRPGPGDRTASDRAGRPRRRPHRRRPRPRPAPSRPRRSARRPQPRPAAMPARPPAAPPAAAARPRRRRPPIPPRSSCSASCSSVCIPAANGGNFVQLAKTAGLRKQGDQGWALKTKDYTLLIANPGSNPDQCHVEITHPADLDSPGRPIIVALNDWATGADQRLVALSQRQERAGRACSSPPAPGSSTGTARNRAWCSPPSASPTAAAAPERRRPRQMIYGVAKTG